MSYRKAEEKALEWIKTQAVLHDPDMIAGGKPLNITGMGNARVNSSIGSQWKNQIKELDQ